MSPSETTEPDWGATQPDKPLFHHDYSRLANAQYVASTAFTPRRATLNVSPHLTADHVRRFASTALDLGASHGGFGLTGDDGNPASMLGSDFSVLSAATDPLGRFTLFCGQVTDLSIGLNPAADLVVDLDYDTRFTRAALDIDHTHRFENGLWMWSSDGGIVPVGRYGRVHAIDVAPSGTWAAVIEDIPEQPVAWITRIELPTGRRSWRVACGTEYNHLRISPDERWIAFAGPGLLEPDTGRCYTMPGAATRFTDWTEHQILGFPFWDTTHRSRLICLGRRINAGPDRSIIFEIDLRTGALENLRAVESPSRPPDASDTPRTDSNLTACDLDPTGRYLLATDRADSPENLADEDSPHTLSCIDVATSSRLWVAPAIFGDVFRCTRNPRWVNRHTDGVPPQAGPLTITLPDWILSEPAREESASSEETVKQRRQGFDTEYAERSISVTNQLLNSEDAREIERLGYILLRDLRTDLELGGSEGLGADVIGALRLRAQGDAPTEVALALARLIADLNRVSSLPLDPAFWQKSASYR